ncbi:hypothetical protein D9C73_019571 [Collichthys lucidus]|uniref:Uncharacterized protein n=1 Tax=Collichthys lucidus TaxID=240159 RepID=A0A4U5VDQ4_COLLU|nr:hypothetical protein D9C73_019571 [Collichthys lucidus]
MITQDRSKLAEENNILVAQTEGFAEEERDVTDEELAPIQDGNKGAACEVEEDSEERLDQGDRIDGATDGELQLKDEEVLCGSERDNPGTSEGDAVAEDPSVPELSPQAWVEALGERQPSDSGSNEEEEEGDRDEVIAEEALGSLVEEVKNEEGSEEKEEVEEITQASVEAILDHVEAGRKRSVFAFSQENSSDSITSSSRGESGRSRQNGDNSKHSPQDGSSESSNGRKEEGTLVSEKKVQVIRKVIRRMSTPTPENQGGDRWLQDIQHSPTLQEDGSEVGMKKPFNFILGEHWWEVNG